MRLLPENVNGFAQNDSGGKRPPNKKIIRAFPSQICAACKVRSGSAVRELCSALKRYQGSILKSSLVQIKDYYLCIRIITRDAPKLLPDICEHSDMVFVGYDYADVISEHGNTVIPSDAINLLSLSP